VKLRRPKTPVTLIVGAMGWCSGHRTSRSTRSRYAWVWPAQTRLDDVLGICSLLFWALVIVVCLKYITFILRVDHDGEGGILALLRSPRRAEVRTHDPLGRAHAGRRRRRSMLLGDGTITPAISVISAVEGIGVVRWPFNPTSLRSRWS